MPAYFLSRGLLAENCGIGVQSVHKLNVLQGVAVNLVVLVDNIGLVNNSFHDFFRADETFEIGVGHLGERKLDSLLELGLLGEGSENSIELAVGRFRPDDETSDVSSGSDLEKVQALNGKKSDTGNIAESTAKSNVVVVDDNGTELLLVATVAHGTASSSVALGGNNLFDVGPDVGALEESYGILGLGEALNFVGHNIWDLRDLFDPVTASLDESRDSRGSNSRSNGVTLLADVDKAVPFAIDLQGSEHATSTAHVSESSLTGAVGTTTTDTGNTSDSTSSTPRFSGGLVTGFLGNSLSLTTVLTDLVEDNAHDIRANRSGEDGGRLDLGISGLSLLVVHSC